MLLFTFLNLLREGDKKMNPNKKAAKIVRVLFILAAVTAIIGLNL
jgi:hypothetical protein